MKTLLVLAAGLGQRFGGIKQLAVVGPEGEHLIDYALQDAKAAGFDKVVFIIKHDIEEDFMEAVGRNAEKIFGDVRYTYQDDAYIPDFYTVPAERVKMLGTVHALISAENAIEEPFAIVNADDYYGEGAYKTIAEYLDGIEGEERRVGMVAYLLKNTVSENGAVTRGVLKQEDEKLVSITETYKILPKDGAIMSFDNSEEGEELDPEGLVSMNFWGMTPDIFAYARAYFEKFLHGMPADDLKTEYPLPVMLDEMLKEGIIDIDVLTSDDKWMGITYPEDLASVKEGLAQLKGQNK